MNVGTIIAWLLGLFGASSGARVVNVVGLAALAPLAYWFLENKDDQAVCFTWGQLAIASLFVLAILKVAHYTPAPAAPRWWPPRQDEREP